MKPLRLRAGVKREQGLLGSAVREGIPLARGADGLSILEGASGRNQIDKELSLAERAAIVRRPPAQLCPRTLKTCDDHDG